MKLKAWIREVALAALTLIAGVGVLQAAPPPLSTYKLLTWNVNGSFADEKYGISDEQRAKEIAKRIIDGGYDIVVFNEVIDQDMRETLVDKLQGDFPHYVQEMDLADGIQQDSGLMVFSKFAPYPLDPIHHVDLDALEDTVCAEDGGIVATASFETAVETPDGKFKQCSAAYHEFTDLAGEDTFAGKGVGWVRVLNPRTNMGVNVFFSHTQADYPDDGVYRLDERAENFDEIRQFVEMFASRSWGETGRENVHLVGDLNAPGDNLNVDMAAIEDKYGSPINEYLEQFQPSGFMDGGFRDAWQDNRARAPIAYPAHDPLSDLGFTWDIERNNNTDDGRSTRYDYILDRQRPASPNCVQHMTIERHFDMAHAGHYTGNDLSDHYGLAAVIGRNAAYCNPFSAKKNALGHLQFHKIEVRGGFQWLRYDNPGTYTFDGGSEFGDLEVTFYDANDLSTPLGVVEGDATVNEGTPEFDPKGKLITGNDPIVFFADSPFFVRIRAMNDAWAGAYEFYARKHTGTSFDDYLYLPAFRDEQDVKMGNVPSAQLKTYFKFQTRALWNMKRQNLEFATSDQHSQPAPGTAIKLKLALFQDAPLHPPVPTIADPNVPVASSFMHNAKISGTVLPPEAGTYFLVVERLAPATLVAAQFDVKWTTNLMEIDLSGLRCNLQEDETFDDTIQIEMTVDGTTYILDYDDMDEWEFQANPDGTNFPLNLHSINIGSGIYFEVFELDGWPDYDPDWLGEAWISNAPPADGSQTGLAHLDFDQDGANYDLDYIKTAWRPVAP